MKKVTVYFFKGWDDTERKNVRSKRPATLDAIAGVHGQAIMDTALEIDEDELDDNGFRKKQNT